MSKDEFYNELVARYGMIQTLKEMIGESIGFDFRLVSAIESDGKVVLQVRMTEKDEVLTIKVILPQLNRANEKVVEGTIEDALQETAQLVVEVIESYQRIFPDAEIGYNWLGD